VGGQKPLMMMMMMGMDAAFFFLLLFFFFFFFSYLGLSLKILTHPATMKEAFEFRGQTIYLLRAQGFKNRQTDSMMHGWVGRSR
jgi:hypothetical protein